MNKNDEIVLKLKNHYKDEKTALKYNSPFELLVAVVLSAQCTDERVNKVTERIFPAFNTPEKMLKLTQSQLEDYIRDCGLFRSKASNLLSACKILMSTYGGQLPKTREEMMKLPGVGRKTANVLVSHIYNTPAIAVDTHVFRVANRLGLAEGKTPLEVEIGLMKAIPKKEWSSAHHWLIWHGRKVCKARNPLCKDCFLQDLCLDVNR